VKTWVRNRPRPVEIVEADTPHERRPQARHVADIRGLAAAFVVRGVASAGEILDPCEPAEHEVLRLAIFRLAGAGDEAVGGVD
jgi:hypothetical protein